MLTKVDLARHPSASHRGLGAGAVLCALLLIVGCDPSSSNSQHQPTPVASYGGGPISEAQYLAIVRGVRECMIEKGYEAEEVEKRTDGVTYGFGFSGGKGSGPSDGSDLVACEQERGLMEAEIAYQDQQSLSGAEREAVYAEFITCLESAGIEGVTSSFNAAEIADLIVERTDAGEDTQSAVQCMDAYASQLFGSMR